MALDNDATLVVGSGNFFKAVTGTAIPADLSAPEVAWENIGHTSIEDILAFESDGGDATILGTLQNSALRTTYSKRTESMSLGLQQWDEDALKLFYGSNANVVDGQLQVPANPDPTVCAFLGVFLDKENYFGVYMPKAEIFRGDNLEISDTESLATLPLRITPLQYGTNDWTYSVTALGAV